MCGLCGVLGGGDHWTESGRATGGLKERSVAQTRRRERAYQVRLANGVLGRYGLCLADWQGASFVLSSHKGASAVIDHFGALWAAAEAMTGSACDPLDPGLIGALASGEPPSGAPASSASSSRSRAKRRAVAA